MKRPKLTDKIGNDEITVEYLRENGYLIAVRHKTHDVYTRNIFPQFRVNHAFEFGNRFYFKVYNGTILLKGKTHLDCIMKAILYERQ